ncbi:transposase is4 [Holotrichia oblita]|uniref:Transposase is4 n=1 Tax=Holotrichia oblita TaxID=644536 RepID=A0ACB9TGT0_HOLOL|nr:transposase is4 [Holotrichia oblita]
MKNPNNFNREDGCGLSKVYKLALESPEQQGPSKTHPRPSNTNRGEASNTDQGTITDMVQRTGTNTHHWSGAGTGYVMRSRRYQQQSLEKKTYILDANEVNNHFDNDDENGDDVMAGEDIIEDDYDVKQNDTEQNDVSAMIDREQEKMKKKANKEETKRALEEFYKTNGLTRKEDIVWLGNIEYQTRPVTFCTPTVTEVIDLPSPYSFFQKYIHDNIFQQMIDKTNLYATEENIYKFPATNIDEIKTFIGVHIIMGNLQYPRVRMYWDSKISIPLVHDNINYNRFSKLRQTLHLVDVTGREEGNNDRVWKVRDIYASIRK